jgi:hypothetical protein
MGAQFDPFLLLSNAQSGLRLLVAFTTGNTSYHQVAHCIHEQLFKDIFLV